jgi:hypothetical protein
MAAERVQENDRGFCLNRAPKTDVLESKIASYVDLSITSSRFFLQQFLSIRMHAAQLFCDGMLWSILLFCQPLDPPDIGKKLADLFFYVIAILFSHESTRSAIRLL